VQVKHAAVAGVSIGFLTGFTICMVIGVSLADGLFRVSILAVSGAWMGVLLVWLNDLLTPGKQNKTLHGHSGRRL